MPAVREVRLHLEHALVPSSSSAYAWTRSRISRQLIGPPAPVRGSDDAAFHGLPRERRPEQRPAAGQAGHHGADRAVDHLGDLAIGQPGHVLQVTAMR